MLRISVLLSVMSLLPAQDRDGAIPTNIQEQLLLLERGNRTQRATAAMQLGAFGIKEAIPGLTAALRYPDTRVKSAALQALNEMGATSATGEVRRLLSSSDMTLRMTAAMTLLHFEDTASYKTIFDLIHNDDVEVRQRITQMLRAIPMTEAAPALQAALEDEDLFVRANAINALGAIDLASSEELIVPFLDAEDERIRGIAFRAVVNIAPEKYEDLLREKFHSGDESLRGQAVAPLLRLRDPDVEEFLFDMDPSTSLLNYFHAAEACEKLRSTRIMQRHIRWSSLGDVLRLISRETGFPVEISPSLRSMLSAVPTSTIKIMGQRPEMFALLSNITPETWNGVQVPISWTFDDGKIRMVTLVEAKEFFQAQAEKRKGDREGNR